MKQILLILAVVALVGCEKEDLSLRLEPTPNGKDAQCPFCEEYFPASDISTHKVRCPKNATDNTANQIKTSPPKHTTDSFEQIQNRIAKNEAVLVDVREKFEWEDGHIQSAIFLPLSDLEEWESDKSYVLNLAKKISKDKIIYCHCVSGGRVMPASAILQKIGYDVRPLKPGYKDLLKAGFEKAK